MAADQQSIAMISSYVPRQCGIATFTHDLASAVAQDVYGQSLATTKALTIVAMNDRDGMYDYGPEVGVQISQHRKEEYRSAAEILNTSRINIVSLQHEFGLFGGREGAYLLELLDRLHKPVVSTLHTIVSEPSDEQLDVLQRICQRSSTVVVMAERARILLNERYDVGADKVRLIPHGVPDVPFCDTEPFKERFGLVGRPTILTFGLLGPSKGIESMLETVAKLIPDHPDLAYVILGATHPAIRRQSGELYRISLERKAVELGIQKNVLFHNRYVSREDLLDYLQAADIYVTPYPNREQITSGTLAYALASGRAIVSTPYWHAEELLASGRGLLVGFGDVDGFATQLLELLGNRQKREEIRRAAYEFGRGMVWSKVARQYAETFEQAGTSFPDVARDLVPQRKAVMRLSLPNVHLDHLFAMTDDTGMLQHSVFSTPDRNHGYCTDDNARALIVAAMVWSLFQDDRALPYLNEYLAFVHFAHVPETGKFRNFMSYDRRWRVEDASHDCQGRAVWALGYLVAHAPNESSARMAAELFRSALPRLESLEWPRSWALSILGLHYYLRQFGEDEHARVVMARLGERLHKRFVESERDGWLWFEEEVTYDNGRLPQALIMAGINLDRQELVDRGLNVLQWLVDIQTAPEGHLSLIGNDGWLRRGGQRARYDQQALEPAALIGACKAAFRVTNNRQWLTEMRRCFEWYLGRNDAGVSLIDFKSRGCFDGLSVSGINENQGAESVLSWLLALLIMHEMQTGDPPAVG